MYILVLNKYMEKFEYKSVTIYYTREIDSNGYFVEDKFLNSKLNEFGKDGWELVQIVEHSNLFTGNNKPMPYWWCCFRRKIA